MTSEPEELAKLAEKAVKFIDQLQKEKSLWECLLALPHVFNPESPDQLLVNLDKLLTNLQKYCKHVDDVHVYSQSVVVIQHCFLQQSFKYYGGTFSRSEERHGVSPSAPRCRHQDHLLHAELAGKR